MNDVALDPIDDPARLEELAELETLDTPPDADFDRLTRLAARLLGAPVALVSLVDRDRQFFKSCIGLPEPWATRRQTPLSHSICQHVVRGREPLVIEDARTHPLVRDNLAVAELGVVAYLGVPLTSEAGRVLGSFCAVDQKPRKWTEADLETLGDLAASVTTELRLRREQTRLRGLHQAVAGHRDRLNVMLNSIADAVVAADAEGLVSFLNPVAERLTGWPAAEAVGRPIEEVFRIVNETTRRPVAQPVRKVIERGGVATLDDHTILIARDGTERPIRDGAAPIQPTAGAAVGAILVFRDVSERVESEREREALVQRLKDADRMKDQFLAMLAHELRNPLSAIRLAVQIAARLNAEEAVSPHLEIVQRQSKQLARLIDDLLDVSRITQGKVRLRLEPTDLRSVVDHAVEQARPSVDAKRHHLSVSLPDEPVALRADPMRLEQVLGNLLTNAAKYTRPGGSIDLVARREDGAVVIRVRDDGLGVSPKMQRRIFDLFAQDDDAVMHSQGGLGIGLTLVKDLIELHGGTVAVASDGPGRGSEFTVRLPFADDL